MSEFRNNISQFIQGQFPEYYREQAGVDITQSNRKVIIDFVEAYYEYIEENYSDTFIKNRMLPEYRDIDTTLQEFVQFFRSKYLANMSYVSATDDRFVIKHIIDLYRSKGTEASIKLLIRLLFNTDSSVYVPGKDIFRLSDSEWTIPIYIETLSNPVNRNLLNRRIQGSLSKANAFVEGVVTKRISGRLIDIIYLSDINGTFVYGDRITADGNILSTSTVIGSLTRVTLDTNSVGGFKIGDIVNIESATGRKAKGVVRSVLSQSGQVAFTLYDGGFGYTADSLTKQYVSDLIIERDNANTIFSLDDRITQRLEKLYPEASSTIAESISIGDTISGMYANTVVANGVVVEVGAETILGVSRDTITVQVEENTFLGNQTLTLAANAEFIASETIVEGEEVSLEITGATGNFANDEIVFWKEPFATANMISEEFAFGEVATANSSVVVLRNAFGSFVANTVIRGQTSGESATIVSANTTVSGASGTLLNTIAPNQIRVLLDGGADYSANTKIYGTKSKVVSTVTVSTYEGTEQILTSNTTANVESTLTSDISFSGIVIGQNNICIGIANTSSNPYVHVANTSIVTNQDDVSFTVFQIASGSGADASIASLENLEEVSLSLDTIDYENVYGIPLSSIKINGEGSGVGYVEDVTIISGGSGYTNGTVIDVTGGGYLDQDVVFPMIGSILTNANGEIVDVTMLDYGEGFFTPPTLTISGGTGANLEPSMIYGYGFESDILANTNTVISDILTTSNVTIGTIASLNASKGIGYSRKPFVRFATPIIESYGVQDQIINLTMISGSFSIGDIITQANTAAKGIIKSKTGSTYDIGTITLNGYFTVGGGIVSANTGSTATLNSAQLDLSNEVVGVNADIQSFIVEETGIIDSIEIKNSGYGYSPEQQIMITANGETITGTAYVEQQGSEEGYWRTRTSHLSSEKRLHDNDYYQEFSYEIRADRSFSKYSDIVLKLLHLSGTKLFGKVVKTDEQIMPITLESTITQV